MRNSRVIRPDINKDIDNSIDFLRNKLAYILTVDDVTKLNTSTQALHNIDEKIYKQIDSEFCTVNKQHINSIYMNLLTTSFIRMSELITKNFDNTFILDNTAHYLRHLFSTAAKLPNGSVVITALLNSLTVIGQGVEGIVTTARIGDAAPIFALKNAIGTTDLLHEGIVGMYCINKLRHYSPVFTYTYALLSGSDPYILSTGEIIWNNSNIGNNTYKHLLTEYVPNSETLENSIKKGISGIEFLSLYRQIIGALSIGDELYQLEHGDLHPGNVLVQEILENTIPTKIARIIDYGRSSFVFANVRLKLPFVLHHEGVPTVLRDAYKLLMYSADIAYHNGNQQVYDIANLIYWFFIDAVGNELQEIINFHTTHPDDYYLYNPIIPETRQYKDLQTYLDTLTETRPIVEVAKVSHISFDKFLKDIQDPLRGKNVDPLIFLLQYEYYQCNNIVAPYSASSSLIVDKVINELNLINIEFNLSAENYMNLLDDAINFLHQIKLMWAYFWAGYYLGLDLKEFEVYLQKQTVNFFAELQQLMLNFTDSGRFDYEFVKFINAI